MIKLSRKVYLREKYEVINYLVCVNFFFVSVQILFWCCFVFTIMVFTKNSKLNHKLGLKYDIKYLLGLSTLEVILLSPYN